MTASSSGNQGKTIRRATAAARCSCRRLRVISVEMSDNYVLRFVRLICARAACAALGFGLVWVSVDRSSVGSAPDAVGICRESVGCFGWIVSPIRTTCTCSTTLDFDERFVGVCSFAFRFRSEGYIYRLDLGCRAHL